MKDWSTNSKTFKAIKKSKPKFDRINCLSSYSKMSFQELGIFFPEGRKLCFRDKSEI